jgi:hypothetical protein
MAPPACENAIRIVHPDDLVKLQEVDMIGLEPAKRFFQSVA